MSPANAAADWCMTVGAPAFSPKRPSIGRLNSSDHTICARPEMPSPSESSGSSAARMSAGSIASSSPSPIICGVTRGDSIASAPSGP